MVVSFRGVGYNELKGGGKMKFSISSKVMIAIALILAVIIVLFNVYDLTVDKSDDRAYTAQDIESMSIEKININTASKETLCLLPGVGESTAEKIIEYREQHGDFEKIEDIKNVKNIGEKTFLQIMPMITV